MIQTIIDMVRSGPVKIGEFELNGDFRFRIVGDDGTVADGSANDLAIAFLCVATGNDIIFHARNIPSSSDRV